MHEMNQPLVSVILPVYKVQQYLPACLDSLLAQTYRNLELLCVNDGSPDDSQTILEQYAHKDSRVRVFCRENGGVSAARNFGLEQARGAYVGFVDPDDVVAPQYLEELMRAADGGEPLVLCGYRKFPDGTVPSCGPADAQPVRLCRIGLENSQYGSAPEMVSCQCWRTLYKRELVEAIRFREDVCIGEDTLFFLDALLRASRYVYVDADLYFYRLRDTSAYREKFTKEKYTELQAWESICEQTAALQGPLHHSAVEQMVMVCARLYYGMLDAQYRDPEMQKKVLDFVRQNREIVQAMEPRPRWKLWSKLKLLSMLYLPAGLNGPVWRAAERLRVRCGGM